MRVIRNLEDIDQKFGDSNVTIGNFDGIHLGHQAIFQKLVSESRDKKRQSVLMTFDPHPKKIIHPERRPFFLLTPLEEKLELIETFGLDYVIMITFSKEFAQTTAEKFVGDILANKLHARKLFVGYDYVFGKNKQGNAAFLKKHGKNLGFEVEEIKAIMLQDTIISSTNIRLAILEGNVRLAAKMLGRPYNIKGTVVKGYRRGTEIIGYPTANIESEKVIPAIGVYAIIAETGGVKYQGVLNIGFNPTFGNERISVEVHLLDFTGDIYGKEVNIKFMDRLRDELKFDSPENLMKQIEKDVASARKILATHFQ